MSFFYLFFTYRLLLSVEESNFGQDLSLALFSPKSQNDLKVDFCHFNTFLSSVAKAATFLFFKTL